MRRVWLLAMLGVLAVSLPARAEVYFAFSAENLDFQGQKRIFYVPFSFSGPAERSLEKRIGVLFEKLHAPRAAIYGDTYLVVKQEANGQYSATLILDEAQSRFHDVIKGEVYLTLANVGIGRLYLGVGGRQMTDADLKYPYFVPTVPIWEALPPVQFAHALIRLGENSYLESAAFYAKLGQKDAALYAQILGLLKGDDSYVKLRVLESLPLLGVANESDHLLPLLNDKDQAVQFRVIELLQAKKEAKVIDALAALADGSKDSEIQLRAAKILVANGRNGYKIYILFEDLKSQDGAVVVETIRKLAASQDKRVLPALVRMLVHEKAEVRAAAFEGVTQMRDLETLKFLLSAPDVDQEFRKQAAIQLMRQTTPEYAKEGIRYLVTVHSGAEAVEAVTTVEMRQYKDMADLLTFALGHADEKVALAALTAIGNLELVDLLPEVSRCTAREVLRQPARDTISKVIAKQPVKKIMELAGSPDLVIRELAVLALVEVAQKGDPQKSEPVLELLDQATKDKEVVIRRAAVKALFDIGGKRNWTRLLKLQGDSDPQVRITVVAAALALQDAAGDEVIVARLDDEDDSVRIAATRGVRERKLKAARPKLRLLVDSRNKEQRVEALRTVVALSETEEEHREYFEVYKNALFDLDPQMQLAAVQGMQWIVDPMVIPLLQSDHLLNHNDPAVRAATLIALGRSRDFNLVEFIARGFADPDKTVAAAAIEGLRLLGHKKALKALDEFIRQTDDEELKAKAQAAMDEIQNQPKGLLEP